MRRYAEITCHESGLLSSGYLDVPGWCDKCEDFVEVDGAALLLELDALKRRIAEIEETIRSMT